MGSQRVRHDRVSNSVLWGDTWLAVGRKQQRAGSLITERSMEKWVGSGEEWWGREASAKVLWPKLHYWAWRGAGGQGRVEQASPLEWTGDVGLGRTEPGWCALIENIGLAPGRVLGRGKVWGRDWTGRQEQKGGDVGSCGPQEARPSARMARRLVLGGQGPVPSTREVLARRGRSPGCCSWLPAPPASLCRPQTDSCA